MTIIGWIRIALITWQAIAGRTKTTADEKIAAELQAALDEYEKTAGSEVTKVQLESLRTTPQW
jgi:hypothetical protein